MTSLFLGGGDQQKWQKVTEGGGVGKSDKKWRFFQGQKKSYRAAGARKKMGQNYYKTGSSQRDPYRVFPLLARKKKAIAGPTKLANGVGKYFTKKNFFLKFSKKNSQLISLASQQFFVG